MAPSRSRAARSRTPTLCVRRARVARPRAVVWYVARCGAADGWHARWLWSTASASWSIAWHVVRSMLYVALIVAPLLQPNTPSAAGHPSTVVGVAVCCTHIGACYQRASHACCIVSSVHRKRAALAMVHRRVARGASCCACAARSGEGRAVAAAERRRDALVRSRTMAACSR